MRDLPKYVHRKHGAYYFVRDGRWTRLGNNIDQIDQAMLPTAFVPSGKEDIHRYALKLLARARSNAKGRRKIEFDLTRDHILHLLNDCDWRCSVTKTPFALETVGPKNQRPYAPSIDRINSARGYSLDNCRMVCVAANFAMNTWGASVLLTMARHAAGKGRGNRQSN